MQLKKLFLTALVAVSTECALQHSHSVNKQALDVTSALNQVAEVQQQIRQATDVYANKMSNGNLPTVESTKQLITSVGHQIQDGIHVVENVIQQLGQITPDTKELIVGPFFQAVVKSGEIVTATWSGRPVDESLLGALGDYENELGQVVRFANQNGNPEYGRTLQQLSTRVDALKNSVRHQHLAARGLDKEAVGSIHNEWEKIQHRLAELPHTNERPATMCSEMDHAIMNLVDLMAHGMTGMTRDPSTSSVAKNMARNALNQASTSLASVISRLAREAPDHDSTPAAHMLAISVSNLAQLTSHLDMPEYTPQLRDQSQKLAQWVTGGVSHEKRGLTDEKALTNEFRGVSDKLNAITAKGGSPQVLCMGMEECIFQMAANLALAQVRGFMNIVAPFAKQAMFAVTSTLSHMTQMLVAHVPTTEGAQAATKLAGTVNHLASLLSDGEFQQYSEALIAQSQKLNLWASRVHVARGVTDEKELTNEFKSAFDKVHSITTKGGSPQILCLGLDECIFQMAANLALAQARGFMNVVMPFAKQAVFAVTTSLSHITQQFLSEVPTAESAQAARKLSGTVNHLTSLLTEGELQQYGQRLSSQAQKLNQWASRAHTARGLTDDKALANEFKGVSDKLNTITAKGGSPQILCMGMDECIFQMAANLALAQARGFMNIVAPFAKQAMFAVTRSLSRMTQMLVSQAPSSEGAAAAHKLSGTVNHLATLCSEGDFQQYGQQLSTQAQKLNQWAMRAHTARGLSEEKALTNEFKGVPDQVKRVTAKGGSPQILCMGMEECIFQMAANLALAQARGFMNIVTPFAKQAIFAVTSTLSHMTQMVMAHAPSPEGAAAANKLSGTVNHLASLLTEGEFQQYSQALNTQAQKLNQWASRAHAARGVMDEKALANEFRGVTDKLSAITAKGGSPQILCMGMEECIFQMAANLALAQVRGFMNIVMPFAKQAMFAVTHSLSRMTQMMVSQAPTTEGAQAAKKLAGTVNHLATLCTDGEFQQYGQSLTTQAQQLDRWASRAHAARGLRDEKALANEFKGVPDQVKSITAKGGSPQILCMGMEECIFQMAANLALAQVRGFMNIVTPFAKQAMFAVTHSLSRMTQMMVSQAPTTEGSQAAKKLAGTVNHLATLCTEGDFQSYGQTLTAQAQKLTQWAARIHTARGLTGENAVTDEKALANEFKSVPDQVQSITNKGGSPQVLCLALDECLLRITASLALATARGFMNVAMPFAKQALSAVTASLAHMTQQILAQDPTTEGAHAATKLSGTVNHLASLMNEGELQHFSQPLFAQAQKLTQWASQMHQARGLSDEMALKNEFKAIPDQVQHIISTDARPQVMCAEIEFYVLRLAGTLVQSSVNGFMNVMAPFAKQALSALSTSISHVASQLIGQTPDAPSVEAAQRLSGSITRLATLCEEQQLGAFAGSLRGDSKRLSDWASQIH